MNDVTSSTGRWILAMVLVSILAIVLLLVYTMTGNDSAIDGAAINAKTDRTNTLTTGREATDEYVNQLEEYSRDQAKKAEQSGASYVTPIIRGNDLITWDDMALKDSQQTEQAPTPIRPAREKTPPAPPVDHSQQLLSLVAHWEHVPHSGHVHSLPVPVENTGTEASLLPAVLTANPLTGLVAVGDVLYGSIDFNIDTDFERSGFIVSTVLSGQLRGAKLFGKFSHKRTSQWGESLTIDFDQIVLTSGVVAPIDAVAVDPKYSRTSIAHEVDHHYFYRWGSLFTASLLKGWEGFASATAQSGTQSAFGIGGGGGTLLRSTPKYSVKDRIMIGSGEMAKELSQVLRENFRRPNTVRVFASHMGGRPVGIVIRSLGSQNRLFQSTQGSAQINDETRGKSDYDSRASVDRTIPKVPAVSYQFPTPDPIQHH